MIQYLVILLDDTSTSFCLNDNMRTKRNLITTDTLKAGILFGMKENLNIQFIYPDYKLPQEYDEIIETIDHIKIKPAAICDDADIVVATGLNEIESLKLQTGISYVLRIHKDEIFSGNSIISKLVEKTDRLNIVLTDIESFSNNDFEKYSEVLTTLSVFIEGEYIKGRSPQLNILTDRMMLDKMNNCGAGDTNITLAPDGKFYVCPAFYQSDAGFSVGSLEDGIKIKNPQLYRLNYAPLCRKCDAYQCRRCIWLNRRSTLEVNTPGHEQCVISHLERNESRKLLINIRKHGSFLPDMDEIPEINYMITKCYT